MARETGIEWTDSTWNPVRGCSRVSEGCRHCYAEGVAARFSGPGLPYEGLIHQVAGEARWNGTVRLVEDRLQDPIRWKEPARIFVNSTSDLFHEALPDDAIDMIFAVMALAPQHTFQVLTKRPERMLEYFEDEYRWAMVEGEAQKIWHEKTGADPSELLAVHGPLSNVWLGVSCEDQDTANWRIPLLLKTPAALRFLSLEPLLGPVDLAALPSASGVGNYLDSLSNAGCDGATVLHKVDWVIAGGESGPGARPAHPDWFRSLRDQCQEAAVPFFFKQWGEWRPSGGWADGRLEPGSHGVSLTGRVAKAADLMTGRISDPEWDGYGIIRRVGKKAAGALLDGVEWRQFPEARAAAVST